MVEPGNFKSNELAAAAYGMDYIFENTGAFEPEETEITVKRVQAMNRQVVQWIAREGRIPTTNPNASLAERKMGHFLRALQFYAHVTFDPQDEHRQERENNDMTHGICQFAIRSGRFPADPDPDSDTDSSGGEDE